MKKIVVEKVTVISNINGLTETNYKESSISTADERCN